MLTLIIIYVLWKNRCKCNDNHNDDDLELNLDYWLDYVDKLKQEQELIYLGLLETRLPTLSTSRHESTRAWIVEHRKVWNMKRNVPDLNRKKSKSNGENLNFIRKNLNKLQFFKKNRKRTLIIHELDKKQTLINYARIDALTHNKRTNFNNNQDNNGSSSALVMKKLSKLSKKRLLKRSYSWPRSKNDYLHTNRYTRCKYHKKFSNITKLNEYLSSFYSLESKIIQTKL